jgi:hypothetical protein
VSKLPTGLTEVPRDNGRIVLVEGEELGHLHMIDAPAAALFSKDLEEEMEGRFLKVEEEVALTHPEHDTIDVAPGVYEVRRQREYTEAGGISVVAD